MAKPGRKTDPFSKEKLAYARARCQARYRGEAYELRLDEFMELWSDYWNEKGRGIDNMCMIRLDKTLPWRWNNVRMVTRRDYLTVEGQYFDTEAKEKAILKKIETHRRKRELQNDGS
jgi:hypothetical protein